MVITHGFHYFNSFIIKNANNFVQYAWKTTLSLHYCDIFNGDENERVKKIIHVQITGKYVEQKGKEKRNYLARIKRKLAHDCFFPAPIEFHPPSEHSGLPIFFLKIVTTIINLHYWNPERPLTDLLTNYHRIWKIEFFLFGGCLKTVYFQLIRFRESIFGQPLAYILSLVALQLEHLPVLGMFDHRSVAGEFL